MARRTQSKRGGRTLRLVTEQILQPLTRKPLDTPLIQSLPTFLPIGGDVSLIVPLVIMVLNPSLTKSLITTLVAVIVFTFIIALSDKKNALGLATAYAAVLVVFVGIVARPILKGGRTLRS